MAAGRFKLKETVLLSGGTVASDPVWCKALLGRYNQTIELYGQHSNFSTCNQICSDLYVGIFPALPEGVGAEALVGRI